MAQNIVRVADVDLNEVSLGTPKSLDNGGKMIPMFHKGKQFIMQIPVMNAPYGISRYPGDGKGDDKLSLDLSFKGCDSNPQVKEFLELMKQLDAKCVEQAFKNGFTWFKKKFASQDVVEALYTPMVKYSKDKETGEVTDKYPPTVKLSIPMRDGACKVEVYDSSRNQISIDDVDLKGADVTAIIQSNGVWVAGGKFGCKFRVLQMKVSPKSSKITGYAFLDDDRIDDA